MKKNLLSWLLLHILAYNCLFSCLVLGGFVGLFFSFFFVWGGVLFWGFLVLLWRFFACVFYSLGEGAFVLPRFLFLNNEVFIQCTVKSTPRVTICPTTLHPNELPSPQVTCTTGCLSTWQVEHAVPNKNPWRSKQAFLLTWQKFRLNRKTYLKLFFHYLALLNHLGKR